MIDLSIFYKQISITKQRMSVFFLIFISYTFAHEFQIVYTQDTILKIQKEINNSEYFESVLPYDLSHMVALLSYNAVSNDMSYVYLRSVMKMYTNFSKQVAFFDADMILPFLDQFTSIMTPIVNKHAIPTFTKQHELAHTNLLYDQLFGTFSIQYNSFKENPEQFLHDISATIVKDSIKNSEYMELQHSIIRFFEHLFSKLLFDPTDQYKSWSTVKQIASYLTSLVDKKIISHVNLLDDVLLSLSSRYTYFLRMFSDTLTSDFLTQIQKEITTTEISLFAYDTNAIFGRKAQLCQAIHECLFVNQKENDQQRPI